MLSQTRVLTILQALADSNRLQLFESLLKSDRNNTELAEETGLRQNLLSHHLNVMLGCGLIRTHQSLGDARRHYYGVDLTVVQYLGEWWDLRNPHTDGPLPALRRPRHVLFTCLYHTTRAVMAEQLAKHLAPAALVPFSAGLRESPELTLLPVAQRVFSDHNLAIGDVAMKTYHDIIATTSLDYVIVVCDVLHEAMLPLELSKIAYLHWSLRDPEEGATDTERETLARDLYDELKLRITLFVQLLAHEEYQAELAC